MLTPIALLLLVLSLGCVNADSPSTITAKDREMLDQIYATYQPWFVKENDSGFRQHAILYYGDEKVATSITPSCLHQTNGKVYLLNVMKDYSIQTCPNYIAARVITNDQHTEQTIFGSLLSGVMYNCPKPNMNMYLYSYNTPCPWCITKWISDFVKACCIRRRRLIIGYQNPYHESESEKMIEKLPNAAMTRMT